MHRKIVTLALLLSACVLFLPATVAAQDDPCAGMTDYAVAFATAAAPFFAVSDEIHFTERDGATITEVEWGRLADAADTALAGLTGITPPPAVMDFHQGHDRVFWTDQ